MLAEGYFEPGISQLTENAKWQVPGLGVGVEGREEVLDFTKGFNQHILHSTEYGDVVECWIEAILPDRVTFKSCVIHRFGGDKITGHTLVPVE